MFVLLVMRWPIPVQLLQKSLPPLHIEEKDSLFSIEKKSASSEEAAQELVNALPAKQTHRDRHSVPEKIRHSD